MAKTKIEWTDQVWNPVTGCTKVSEGCRNCYAERMSKRLAGRCGYPKDEPFRVTLHPEKLDEPLKWKKPRRVFVCSMGDLFHEDVPDEFIEDVFSRIGFIGVMRDPSHTFVILTKRPMRMYELLNNHDFVETVTYVSGDEGDGHLGWPFPNLWLGVSAENQSAADERIPLLLETPAAVRFVSCEPLLGPVDLTHLHYDNAVEIDALNGTHGVVRPHVGVNEKLSWVIIGGETGPGARPMHPD